MLIGAFQFRAVNSIEKNLQSIRRGVELASRKGVRVLLTQECGLTGYPPLETPTISDIDQDTVAEALAELQDLSNQANMFVGVGAVLADKDQTKNSIMFLCPDQRDPVRYDKRALWGWDTDNFSVGSREGIFTVDGVKLGVRICFEIRFPEFFRELFKSQVDVALVSFCDTSKEQNQSRRNLIHSHIITRAVENAFVVITANSISDFQTTPTCLVSPDGLTICEAPQTEEELIIYDFNQDVGNFDRAGRIETSRNIDNLTYRFT